ncbi:MAG TPA: squalene synthase HpnC [Burkholderiaceae bacterium]|jgi:squalene synthase HpnC|nr:squalene synthase HpnC [Burkholderiaceae bacterium]
MKTSEDFGTGKTQENFPVASRLVAPNLRAPILAYYRFARAADDVADHPELKPATKFDLLDGLQATLLGSTDRDPAALPLRAQLRERALSPEHALDLLTAFRMDVTKRRYRDWDELMHYCRYSAMPVGRFVLEVHGESRATWDASDPLCSALQVINHLQDCKKDYQALDRVYVPLDALERYGLGVEALAAPRATPQLQACLQSVAQKTQSLLPQGAQLPHLVKDLRLGIETAVIAAVARKLAGWLLERDPLSERVHLSRVEALWLAATAVIAELLRRRVGAPSRATHGGGA